MTSLSPQHESSVLAGVISEVEAALAEALATRDLAPDLADAIRYTVLAPGKRLRPALVMLCCEAAGGERRLAALPAAAIELIHNFSLVHDDLPAMDDDHLRRGRPTLHIHAGEAMAILAGDAMQSIAFELLAEAPFPDRTRVELMRELSIATTGMITGQVYDTLGGMPAGLQPEQMLGLIHRHKTGALLRAACRMGARCAGASRATLDALTEYGDAIGLMFQIVDDLLDVTQSAEHIGKATHKDTEAGKLTYPGLLGVDRSREEVERLHAAARSALDSLGPAAEPLRSLAQDLAIRTK